MVYLALRLVVITDRFKIVTICARNVHGQKRLDDDATGRYQHQRSNGQTAPTRPSDVF